MKSSSSMQLDLGVLGMQECEVIFNYERGYPQTWENPEEPEEFEIEQVLLNGVDVYQLCGKEVFHDLIVEAIIENKGE
jgi:hypothetical protein